MPPFISMKFMSQKCLNSNITNSIGYQMKVDVGSKTKLGSINLWQITNIRSLTIFLKPSKLLSIHCHLSYPNSRGNVEKFLLSSCNSSQFLKPWLCSLKTEFIVCRGRYKCKPSWINKDFSNTQRSNCKAKQNLKPGCTCDSRLETRY